MPTQAQRMDEIEEEMSTLKDSLRGQFQNLEQNLDQKLAQTASLQATMNKLSENQMILTESQSKMMEDQIRIRIREEIRSSGGSHGGGQFRGMSPSTKGGDGVLGPNPAHIFASQGRMSGREDQSGFNITFGRVQGEESGDRPPENSFGGGGTWRYRKLECPVFDGDNPDGWIVRMERYFAYHQMTEKENVQAAVVSLDGDALLWFQWENRRCPISRWSELKDLVLRYFRKPHAGSLYE